MAHHRSFVRFGTLIASLAPLLGLGCSEHADAGPEERQSGTLVRTIGRANDGKTTIIEYHLKSGSNLTRLIGPKEVLESQEPNTRVTVTGRASLNDRELLVDALEPSVESSGELGTTRENLSTNAPRGRVAVFLVKDETLAEDPFPAQEAIDTIFQSSTSTNRYFQEVTYGAFGLSGDVFGWYPMNLDNCDSTFLTQPIHDLAAAQDGFVTDNYRHAIHIFRRAAGDCFLAKGSFGVPDGTGLVWSFWNTSNVFAHELGHNFGLDHASSLTCTNSAFQYVPFGTRCTSTEYNDPFDAMGFEGSYYHFNSYSKSLQGWVPAARQRRVTTPGNVTIVPQETAVSGTQSLLVPVPNTNQAWHVEMRRQTGAFDDEARFNGAVLVRRVFDPGLRIQTFLLDMSADGNNSDASLQVGQTFQDPTTGIAIRLVSRTSTQAVVNVAFNGPRCNDGIKNGTETDLDCGGSCGPCDIGKICQRHRDCNGSACVSGACVASAGGLTGQYYNGTNFESLAFTRHDRSVDFEWGMDQPLPAVGSDQFSVRWTGKVLPPQTATYTFRTDTDDGVRLWVNNQLIIDNWNDGVFANQGTIALTGGQQYDIRMDYYENAGGAGARLRWSNPSMPLDLVPATRLLPSAACTTQNAIDLGPRNGLVTVANNACVKVSQYPSWWGFTNGLVTLQSGGNGSFPVPAAWKDACTGTASIFNFTTTWQSQPIGFHTSSCPALIQLSGSGGSVQVSWW